MDETCGRLIAAGKIRPLIVVGIPHSGTTRTAEYLPPVTKEEVVVGLTPQGDAHLAWLLNEVMPRVERSFRVATGPENTGIGGSSLGGLISLYAGAKHPERFGFVLAESPSLRFGKNEFGLKLFADVPVWPAKVYLAVGTAEAGAGNAASVDYAAAVTALDAVLTERGLNATRKKFILEDGAAHTEDAWAKRLPVAMQFLFGTP
jgi:enterochelin esterase-like enzyme